MTASDNAAAPEALAHMHAAIEANAPTLHDIVSRTGAQHIASEVLRLNHAVRTAAQGRLDSRAQPGDFAALLRTHAECEAPDGVDQRPADLRDTVGLSGTPPPKPPAGATFPLTAASEPDTLCYASIAEIGQRLRCGDLTATALTRAVLARAHAAQPAHRAFIALQGDAALAQAEHCDEALRAGHWRGPLHGVPLAHKDCFERDGAPMTVGSNVPAAPGPGVTATVLAKLTAAGAIDLGPLNMNEMVCGPTGQNPHFGDCTNAWDATRTSGGSSSGSAVAVALGAAFGSLGSDTGGSIRLPASMNGVFGLKPTYGLVSRHGCFPRAFSLDCVGPLARSAQDCAILLTAIAGYDRFDPTSADVNVPDYAGDALRSAARGSRIGRARM